MNGTATAASASRIATLVCVNAAGLITMNPTPALVAPWMRSTSAPSWLDWKPRGSRLRGASGLQAGVDLRQRGGP